MDREGAHASGPANAQYGYCTWFLNTGRKSLAAAPASSVTFLGNGQNVVYIDWDNDIVAVVRWIDTSESLNAFIGRVLGSLRSR